MFKGKPSLHTFARKHTRKYTTVCTVSLAHIRQEREKGGGGGKNTKDWKHTYSLLSDDSGLEENPDKTRQSGNNCSVWWFNFKAQRQKMFRFLPPSVVPQHRLYLEPADPSRPAWNWAASAITTRACSTSLALCFAHFLLKWAKTCPLGCNFTPPPHVGSALHPAPSSGVRYTA